MKRFIFRGGALGLPLITDEYGKVLAFATPKGRIKTADKATRVVRIDEKTGDGVIDSLVYPGRSWPYKRMVVINDTRHDAETHLRDYLQREANRGLRQELERSAASKMREAEENDVLIRGNADAREFARKVMKACGVRPVTPDDYPHPDNDRYRVLVKTTNTRHNVGMSAERAVALYIRNLGDKQ